MLRVDELENAPLTSVRSQPVEGRTTHAGWFRLLWSRRGFILRVTLATAVLSIIISLLLPPTYEATTTLLPSDPSSSALSGILTGKLGALADVAASSGGLGLQTPGARFIAMLRSRTIADRLIDKFDLMKLYRTKLRSVARKILETRTAIAEDRRTGVITLTVQDRDKYRAARLASAYVEELDHLNIQLNTSSAHRERVFLDARVDEVTKQLDTVAKQLAAYSSKNTVVGIQDQGRAMIDAAARLQGELVAAEANRSGLEEIYTSDNVRVRETRAQIGELKRQLLELRGRDPSPAGGKQNPDPLPFPSLRSLPGLGVTYAELYRENRVLETVFEILTQQLELSKIAEIKELPTVRTMDPPEVPELRTGPRRKAIVVLCTFLGLILAALWIVVGAEWEGLDPQNPYKSAVSQLRETMLGNRYRVNFKPQTHISERG